MDHNNRQHSGSIPKAIFEILDQQIRLLGDLEQLVNEDKTALAGMNLNVLIDAGRKKESLISRIEKLDATLQDTARSITGLSREQPVKLAHLKPFATPDERLLLEQRKKTLDAMREKLLADNQRNKRFSKDVLGYLSDAINFITGAVREQALYGAAGKSRAGSNGPALISREV